MTEPVSQATSHAAQAARQVCWTLPARTDGGAVSHPFLAWLGAVWVSPYPQAAPALRLSLQAHHANRWGVAHGGVVATLLDSVMAQALRQAWSPNDPASVGLVTLDLQTRFFQPAQGELLAQAEVLSALATTGQAQAWLWARDAQGREHRVAMATASFQRLRALPAQARGAKSSAPAASSPDPGDGPVPAADAECPMPASPHGAGPESPCPSSSSGV